MSSLPPIRVGYPASFLPLVSSSQVKMNISIEQSNVKECVMHTMSRRFSDIRSKAHKHYKNLHGGNSARQKPHKELAERPDDWILLCNYFDSEAFKKKSKSNVHNRSKVKFLHRTGTKSLIAHQYEQAELNYTRKNLPTRQRNEYPKNAEKIMSVVSVGNRMKSSFSIQWREIDLPLTLCDLRPSSIQILFAGSLSLRLQQLDVKCETKSKNNVFVNVVASVQYRALADNANDACYKLSNTRTQIQAYVYDVIRASVPKLTLDDAFEQKNEIAKAVEVRDGLLQSNQVQ